MSIENTINAYFVTTALTSGDGESESVMAEALTLLKKDGHVPEKNIRQIKASEGFPLIANGSLTKKDVFVFDKFEGDFFSQLQQTKSLIIGPRCLCSCLMRSLPIPLGTSPVYTTAMRDLHISATGITPKEKERIRVLIQWMGGYYFQNFGRSITHLVSNTIKSTKYEHATLNGIPVMHVDWVQRVWDRSCVNYVTATDDEFNKYHLPIFFGTNITCTGLETEKKNEVMRLVNENGGTYHRAFRSQLVDIVITEKNKTNSDKYQAAVRFKKDILIPEWIFESVQKGFALPTKAYQVKTVKVSTPTKTDQSVADFTASDISRISAAGCKRTGSDGATADVTMNDTICSMNSTQQAPVFVAPAPLKDLQRESLKKIGASSHYRLVYDEICPKQAKKAGNFLDGCCIYLSGFRTEEREKLNRILNVGGATRYDVVNEKITHIIVGQLDDAEFKSWKRDGLLTAVNIVRLDWLLESIKLKQPASEVVYRMILPTSREPDAPSPSSKKTLRSMNHSFKQPDMPIKKKLFQANSATTSVHQESESTSVQQPHDADENIPLEDDEQHLIAQYSQEHEPLATPPAPLPQSAPAVDISMHPQASSTQREPVTTSAAAPAAVPARNPSEMTDGTMCTIDYEHLDFFQGMSVYIDKEHFPEEFYTQMISECEAAHGNVVANNFRDLVDYAIVSFERTLDASRLPVNARHIITELYVESCMKQNTLVPIEYYHKHIPHTAESLPLEGMTIVVSIYAGLERDYIDSISQLLGANVNKTFVKKEKPLLVCPSPEGSKYQGALKWRYPVVTSEWLVHCANQGKKLSYRNYLVGESPESFPISPTMKEQRTPLDPVPMDVDVLQNNAAHNNVATPQPNTSHTSTDFTPLRNKRVSELAGPTRTPHQSASNTSTSGGSTSESPRTPPNNLIRASYNFEYMEKLAAEMENETDRQCLRELIIEMRNNQTPELERIRRQACTPIKHKIPTPKGIPDFCTTPEFEKRMADEFERRWRLPTKKIKPDTPIDEIRKRVMRITCRRLGIPVSGGSSDDEEESESSSALVKKPAASTKPATSITPLQHKSMRSGNNPMPRTILTPNQNAANTTASQTIVPNTQSPNSSRAPHDTVDSLMRGGLGQRASLGKSTTINFDKISFEETGMGENNNSNTSDATAAAVKSMAASSPEIKQITDYLKNCESRRESLKFKSAARAQAHHADEMMETETGAHYVQPFETEQFGAGSEEMVGWKDPAEFSLERRRPQAPTMQFKGTPRFSISCGEEDTRIDLIFRIERLGGEVCDNLINYDPTSTHFICERPNRGEKMLGCISAGKWALSIKYIEECSAKGAFLDEELYEWGNGKAYNKPKLSQDELVIASAAHCWRKRLASDPGAGAFSGVRVIFRVSERHLDALKTVIKAGKGAVIEAQSPYSESSETGKATHCFVDVKKMPLTKNDYDFLKANGVAVLSQMYINSYLMNGSDDDFAKYEIKM